MVNAVNIFWTTFLSFIAASKNRKTTEKTEEEVQSSETVVDVPKQTEVSEVKATEEVKAETTSQ